MLIHGDCLTELSQVPDDSVDMVFADLPYGVTEAKYDTHKGKSPRSKPIDKREYAMDMSALWKELHRIGKRNAAFIFTATQPFGAYLIYSNPKLFKYELIWDKVRASRWMHAKNMPLARHENLLVFYRQKPTYNPQMLPRDKPMKYGGVRVRSENYSGDRNRASCAGRVYTDKHPDSILRHCKENFTKHPTQKPVALLEWLIKTYSNPGEVILDPTMGSGTTGVACKTTGREFIGIEKDATYYDVASKRIAEAAAA